tara:strand:+ start:223 stop:1221 length:999 start_codon:yes stop_codon:yes gene_type:complete
MKTIIIAEAGVNHNGNLKKALKMVDIASKAKADYIKFQTFIPTDLCQKKFGLADYQKKSFKKKSQFEMLNSLKLSFKDFKIIKKRCKKKNINFMSSPFDIRSLEFLKSLKVKYIKVASGEITNIPLLREIGRLKKKVIMSSGMSNIKEIRSALKILTSQGTKKKDITVLHCNTEYPATTNTLNLMSIRYLKDKLKTKVGYSDHSLGHEASLIALAFGATILEKHFTMDKKLKGPDQKSSLKPSELIQYIKNVRKFEKSLGNYFKKPYGAEIKNIDVIRKQIVAKTYINKGDIFSEKNIITKRATKGIAASKWDKVLGRKSGFNFKPDENIKI